MLVLLTKHSAEIYILSKKLVNKGPIKKQTNYDFILIKHFMRPYRMALMAGGKGGDVFVKTRAIVIKQGQLSRLGADYKLCHLS